MTLSPMAFPTKPAVWPSLWTDPAEGRMTNGTALAGDRAADFPASKVVDEPINRDAH